MQRFQKAIRRKLDKYRVYSDENIPQIKPLKFTFDHNGAKINIRPVVNSRLPKCLPQRLKAQEEKPKTKPFAFSKTKTIKFDNKPPQIEKQTEKGFPVSSKSPSVQGSKFPSR